MILLRYIIAMIFVTTHLFCATEELSFGIDLTTIQDLKDAIKPLEGNEDFKDLNINCTKLIKSIEDQNKEKAKQCISSIMKLFSNKQKYTEYFECPENYCKGHTEVFKSEKKEKEHEYLERLRNHESIDSQTVKHVETRWIGGNWLWRLWNSTTDKPWEIYISYSHKDQSIRDCTKIGTRNIKMPTHNILNLIKNINYNIQIFFLHKAIEALTQKDNESSLRIEQLEKAVDIQYKT